MASERGENIDVSENSVGHVVSSRKRAPCEIIRYESVVEEGSNLGSSRMTSPSIISSEINEELEGQRDYSHRRGSTGLPFPVRVDLSSSFPLDALERKSEDPIPKETNLKTIVATDLEEKNSNGSDFGNLPPRVNYLRRSIIEMEKSNACRYFVLISFIIFTAIITYLTTISFLRIAGRFPLKPEVSRLLKAVDAYNQHSDNVTKNIEANITYLYSESKTAQRSNCLNAMEFVERERTESMNSSSYFVDNFCAIIGNRALTLLESIRGSLPEECSTQTYCNGIPSPIITNYWFTSIIPEFDCSEEDAEGRCFHFIKLQKNPIYCEASRDTWDRVDVCRHLITDEMYPKDRACLKTKQELQDIYKNHAEVMANSETFRSSLEARMIYDYNYFTTSVELIDMYAKLGLQIDSNLDLLRHSFDDLQLRFDAQVNLANKMYSAFNDIFSKIPVDLHGLFGLDGINVNPPSLNSPGIPSFQIDAIETNLPNLNPFPRFLEGYNPPGLASSKINQINGIDTPRYEPRLPEVTYTPSPLVDEVLNILKGVFDLISRITSLDLIVRIVTYFVYISQLFQENRRDFSTSTSKLKRALGSVFSRATWVLYIGFFMYLAISIIGFDFDFSSITVEKEVDCDRNAQIRGNELLSEYSRKLFEERSSCQTEINYGNNRTSDFNSLREELLRVAMPFVKLYQSDNRGENMTQSKKGLPIPLTDFRISSDDLVYKGSIHSGLPITDLELYTVDSSGCSGSPEAQQVEFELDQASKEMKQFISQTLIILIMLNIGARLMMGGLFNWFWMYLTQGYAFDKEFTSADLRQKNRTKFYQGLAQFLLGFSVTIAAFFNESLLSGIYT